MEQRNFIRETADEGYKAYRDKGGKVGMPSSLAPEMFKQINKLREKGHSYSEIAKRNPRKRVGTPEDMAGLAIFLCSRAGAYTVGETITSDGGIVKTASHNLN